VSCCEAKSVKLCKRHPRVNARRVGAAVQEYCNSFLEEGLVLENRSTPMCIKDKESAMDLWYAPM